MVITQVNNDQLNSIVIPGKEGTALLLDYKSYFDPAYRERLFAGDLTSLKSKHDLICSPFEAMAAWLKDQRPEIQGDVQLIDLEGPCCHTSTIRFFDGRYLLNKDSVRCDIPLAPLYQHHLHRDHQEVHAFDLFLEQKDQKGKAFGASVALAILEQENGNRQYDNLIKVFDHEQWADIRIAQLLALKDNIIKLVATDQHHVPFFCGQLSTVLSGHYSPQNRLAKIHGTAKVFEYGSSFYAASAAAIKLQVYNHPDHIDLILFPVNTPYEDYSISQKLQLFNTGEITLFRNDRPISIKYGIKIMNPIDIEIRLDGNQHLLTTVDDQVYLL